MSLYVSNQRTAVCITLVADTTNIRIHTRMCVPDMRALIV